MHERVNVNARYLLINYFAEMQMTYATLFIVTVDKALFNV